MRPLKTVEQTIELWNKWCKGSRPENPGRVSGWIRDRLIAAWQNDRRFTIMTQWCLSSAIMKRAQGSYARVELYVLSTEKKTFRDIGRMKNALLELGWLVDWWIVLAPSSLPSGRLGSPWASLYSGLLQSELERTIDDPAGVLLISSEKCMTLPHPNDEEIERIMKDVHPEAYRRECDRRRSWATNAGLVITDTDIAEDVRYQITWEAMEGELIARSCSDWILVPLEGVERFSFHKMLAPDFGQRLLPILRPYPWRGME